MRSWLLVPAEDEEKLEHAAAAGADAVVVDLDRGTGGSERDSARERARDWIAAQKHQVLERRQFTRWVRISPIANPNWREDLRTALAGAPEGILLPDAPSSAYVQQLAAEFYDLEQRSGIAHGATQIIPLVAATPGAALNVGQFAVETHPRLTGIGWEAGRLADAIDARRERDDNDAWSGAFAHARAQLILAAKAPGLMAIESPAPDGMDLKRFKKMAEAARADGFTGMFAYDPAQIPAINEAFAPSEKEVARAQGVVAQFSSNPNADHVALGGRVVDRTHLERARLLLEDVSAATG